MVFSSSELEHGLLTRQIETWKITARTHVIFLETVIAYFNIQFTLHHNCIEEHERIKTAVQGKIVAVVVVVTPSQSTKSNWLYYWLY